MTISQSAMLPAFTDDVTQTQQTFRQLMTAMSEPATIMTLAQPVANNHTTNNPISYNLNGDEQQAYKKDLFNSLTAIWAVAQTVLDSDVSVFVAGDISEILAKSIRFFTGATLVDSPNLAEYIIINIADVASLLEQHELNVGTLEKPHTSSTVIVLTDALSNEAMIESSANYKDNILNKRRLQVTGPGIKNIRQLNIAGMTENIVEHLQSNQQLFPCGIDWIFCADKQLTALPRTSQVQLSVQDA